jgi:hypothetical protein
MRQIVFDRFFIFSAHNNDLDTNTNHIRTREAYNVLLDKGINFVCVTGCYNGQREPSFMVFDSEGVESEIKALCEVYKQESYLVRRKDNTGVLEFLDGKSRELGDTLEVAQRDLKDLDDYIIIPQKDNVKKYFTFGRKQ